jgi:sucrose phosphorylase
VLNALATGSAARLGEHLARSPERQFTMLDCHDGIPVRPDLDGILDHADMLSLAELVQSQGGNVNRILSEAHADGDIDIHQLNCTYYAALGCDDERYVAARAIQLFARGVPQIYYVGLLAGENDQQAAVDTGDGRAVNRHNYTVEEVEAAIQRPVVRRVLELVRLRNTERAFSGRLEVTLIDAATIRMTWRLYPDICELEVHLPSGRTSITTSVGAPATII